MSELSFIENYLQPLAKGFEDALNLNDDAAILNNIKNQNFVVSVDNFITSIHCPYWLRPNYSITRAILVAASDLSAMAAKPYCIFLSISIPKIKKRNLFKHLKEGINKGLFLTGMKLAGGDLCVYDGPLSFCITVVGTGKKKNILRRTGAKVSDYLCITGTIGDAKIGLDLLLNKKKVNKIILADSSVSKFLYPLVRSNFSQKIAKYTSSCIDISDGLMIDVAKLARNSNCGLRVLSKNIPLSITAEKKIKIKQYSFKDLISAGDDYELAFSVKKNNLEKVKEIAKNNNIQFTVIGEFTKGHSVLLDKKSFTKGYSHL